MKQIRIYIALLFVTMLSSEASAQLVSPVDFMRNNPKAISANPAFFTKDFGYFDLLLGGFNFNVQKVGIKYDNFFRFNENGQPVVLDLNQGVAGLRDMNYLNTCASFDIFSCGRRTKHGYFTYTHRFREVETFGFSRDMMQLLVQGNGSYLGEDNPADIKVDLASRAFQEFSFGYQMSLTNELNIGIRLKFLMGYLDAKINDFNLKLYTDPETYALKLMANADAVFSMPYELEIENGKIVGIVDKRFNPAALFKNYGGGVDLGAEYKFNDQWGAAVAVNDLGWIRWNHHSVTVVGSLEDNGSFYDNGSFVFNGLSSEQINAMMNDPEYAAGLADSLSGYLGLTYGKSMGYTTGLNANLMARGYFDLTPEHRFSAQFTGYNMGLGIKPAFTLAYTGSFGDKYDVVATYTMMPGSYDNLGIGLSANFGGLLLYFASNNILGFIDAGNFTGANLQVGMSFTSGEFVDRSQTVIIKDKLAEAEAEAEESGLK